MGRDGFDKDIQMGINGGATMKISGTKTIDISALDLPGDIAKRRKSPRVKELADSIRAHGLAHLPVIDPSNRMVVGRDRIAALMELGQATVEVRVATGTPDELKALELTENIHRRRDDLDAMRAQYVDVLERIISSQKARERPADASGPGRPQTPRGEAVDAVAAASGVSRDAIRKSVARAEADEGDDPEGPADYGPMPPPVETWGVPVEHLAQEFAEVRLVQAACDEASRHMKAARSAIGALKDGGKLAQEMYSRMFRDVDGAEREVKFWRPKYLCPYCKGLLHRRAKCTGCAGCGYLGQQAIEGIAQELQRTGKDALVVGEKGGFLTLAEASTPNAPPKGKKVVPPTEPTDEELAALDAHPEDDDVAF